MEYFSMESCIGYFEVNTLTSLRNNECGNTDDEEYQEEGQGRNMQLVESQEAIFGESGRVSEHVI